MPTEMLVLGLGAVLLLAHVLIAGNVRTRQYSTDWNMGARDETMPPLNPLAGRLVRAQANYLETLPLVIIALVGVTLAGKATQWTGIAAWVWLAGRAIYLPLYAAGIPKIRTLVWSIASLAMVFVLGVFLLGPVTG
ncbi:MAG: MAPEG family protein [Croceibacterium sp.]